MQFEVVENPVPQARRTFPYVVVLQADVAATEQKRLVAPMVPRSMAPDLAGRLNPLISVGGIDHILLVPSLAPVPTAALKRTFGSIAGHRDSVTAALDYLFQGI